MICSTQQLAEIFKMTVGGHKIMRRSGLLIAPSPQKLFQLNIFAKDLFN